VGLLDGAVIPGRLQTRKLQQLVLFLALYVSVVACGGEPPLNRSRTAGTLIIVTTADAGSLFPPLVRSTVARQVTEQIYDYLADVGNGMNTIGDRGFAPRLAKSWGWSRDSLAIRFRIDSAARWHDGVPVRSDDVSFTFKIYTDAAVASSTGSQLKNIDSITTPDSLTAVFWFHKRYSLQFFDASSQMQILPRHILGGIRMESLANATDTLKPIGSGRFRFVRWVRGSSLELGPDVTNYRGPPKLGRVIWSVTPSAVVASARLFAGDADLYDVLRRENVADIASHPQIRIVTLPSTDYVFLQFNLRDPKRRNRPHWLFASRELRRALSMGVNRAALVRNVFDTLAVPGIGPTIRAFPTTDLNLPQLPYDPQTAERMLDSLGWRDSNRDGIRERNGRQLRFTLIVPSTSLNRLRMGVLLQEQLRKIGVRVDLDEMEFATFQARQQARDFDANLANWHLGASPGSIREIWGSQAARDAGGINYGSYINPKFDAYVDSAIATTDSAANRRYYNFAYRIAIEDAPAIWLYEPRTVIGIHRRIKTGPMRPDAWWTSLGDWYIPPAERLARDRLRR
jgi:peptide/nickel transport system substrate-binding protein